MAEWPIDLPQTQFLNLSFRREPNVIRTEMGVGPAKVRRRFTAAVVTFQIPMELDGNQLDTFEAWFDQTLKDGTVPFDWEDPRTDQAVAFRFRGPVTWTMISGARDPDARRYEGTLDLEVLP